METDEVLASAAVTISKIAVIYMVDITKVPDFNDMYVMFFFRNKHIMIDLGTRKKNRINWALKGQQEFIETVENT
ncbi:putative DIM-like protein [Cinnamomum micranthum f. kanehirae]|uniref:Putative DIM-like protein n=1 Tax=Cinnamomum micranthum f. kanehirae TaxID=337451 RepID=A0A3S3NM52_9MAGN|nr:putative DIM-like protein [Cinnamomum micranthum f. kanehirae]